MFRNILFGRSLGFTLSLIFEGGPCLNYPTSFGLNVFLLALGESIVLLNVRGPKMCRYPHSVLSVNLNMCRSQRRRRENILTPIIRSRILFQ